MDGERSPRPGPFARAKENYRKRTGQDSESGLYPALQPGMIRRYEEQADLLGLVCRAVAGVTDAAGVPGCVRFWYQGFGRQAFKLWRNRQRREYQEELVLLREKWRIRGLDPDLLRQVQTAVIAALEEGAKEKG